jgi:ATP-dependent RNA helicase RhlE
MPDDNFSGLGLAEPVLRALAERGHATPTPIQARAIPGHLAGRDILGIAQTGTGKTAAFVLPILHRLSARPPAQSTAQPGRSRRPRALILAPTRELALQIGAEVRDYSRYLDLRHTVVFGGVKEGPQIAALARGIDILVATPGRLLDLVERRRADLGAIEVLVLDEADRMLDMGFIRDVRKLVAALPADRQALLFSATMPDEIARLADGLLRDPLRVEVTPRSTPVERIEQSVYHLAAAEKTSKLAELLGDPSLDKVIVFTRTKHRANRVSEALARQGVEAQAIHGNKSQGARQRALAAFRNGEARVLVATDIAARGIDVDGISHVINFELPNEPEAYVHRIGRTARAGASGTAISLCDAEERDYLRQIERLTGVVLTVVGPAPGPERKNAKASARKPNAQKPANATAAPHRRRRRRRAA